MQEALFRRLALLTLASVAVRIASAVVVAQPGYTDAYYYVNVASRFARGLGLTADFIWNPIELGPLPVVSHRFWMPLATVFQGAGIALFGPLLGDFRAAQLAIVVIAACLPAATYAAARALGASVNGSLIAGAVVGAWLARDLSIGPAAGLVSRTALLVRYEDFFAVRGVSDTIFTAPLQDVVGARVAALGANAATFLFSYGLVLAVPLAIGVRVLWAHAHVRAWTSLALLIFAAESLVWT